MPRLAGRWNPYLGLDDEFKLDEEPSGAAVDMPSAGPYTQPQQPYQPPPGSFFVPPQGALGGSPVAAPSRSRRGGSSSPASRAPGRHSRFRPANRARCSPAVSLERWGRAGQNPTLTWRWRSSVSRSILRDRTAVHSWTRLR
jgi:hypothetical protein